MADYKTYINNKNNRPRNKEILNRLNPNELNSTKRFLREPGDLGRVNHPPNLMSRFAKAASKTRSVKALQAYGKSPMHRSGMEGIKWGFGKGLITGKGVLGKAFGALGPISYLYGAYTGYQEGGIGGAVKGVAEFVAFDYALGVAQWAAKSAAIGGIVKSAGIGAAIAGGGALGMYLASGGQMKDFTAPWVRDYSKRHGKLEMGTPVVDNFGTAATMRQRSLNAIQNSRISGRNALGFEAMLQPFR